MITSEKILTVIGYLKNALPLATREDHLNMEEDAIIEVGRNPCGTIHCHAGWYFIGKKGADSIRNMGRNYLGYSYGRDAIAHDLGFDESGDVPKYFSEKYNLWGNTNGVNMFGSKIAFYHPTKRPEGAENLQHIIDHWTEVYERFLVMEGKELVMEGKEIEEKVKHVYHAVQVPSSITEQTKELIMQ